MAEKALKRRALALVFMASSLMASQAFANDIFMKRMPDGTVYFTDNPQAEDFKVVIRDPDMPKPQPPTPKTWKDIAHVEAKKSNIDPKLVRAVIMVESGENPNAVSDKGAMGLMQLMPTTARELGVTEPFKPSQNVKGGVEYLSRMIDRFGGNVRLALAAYNAGPGAVEKYGGIPPFKETQDFVKKVLDTKRKVSLKD